MENMICVSEINNKLEIDGTYTPLVCGNSNYFIKFTFGEAWSECKNKLAVFELNSVKTIVQFDGDIVQVPVLPNATFLLLSLMSSNASNRLATTALKLRLEPSSCGGDYSKFDNIANSASRLIGIVNSIENGNIEVKNAQRSTSALVAENVSNPNLLINGDFRVNQRGQKEYQGSGKYTVDRWRLVGDGVLKINQDSSVTFSSASDTVSGLCYHVDNPSFLSNKTFTISAKGKFCSGIKFLVTQNGEVVSELVVESEETQSIEFVVIFGEVLDTDSVTLKILLVPQDENTEKLTLEFVKLEIGNHATIFCPRTYSEELLACKRYYQSFADNLETDNCTYIGTFWAVSKNNGFMLLNLDVGMRKCPTIKQKNLCYRVGDKFMPFSKLLLSGCDNNHSKIKVFGSGTFSEGGVYPVCLQGSEASLNFDAEIY